MDSLLKSVSFLVTEESNCYVKIMPLFRTGRAISDDVWQMNGFCDATDPGLDDPAPGLPHYFGINVDGSTHHQEIKIRSSEMPSTGFICEIESMNKSDSFI